LRALANRKDFERLCRLRLSWSFLMHRFHLAIITVGPARTGTSTLMHLRLGLRRSPRHIKRWVDSWVAAILVRREQQAANWAQDRLSRRALRGASSRDIRIEPGRPR
jgi:hypothetical protein